MTTEVKSAWAERRLAEVMKTSSFIFQQKAAQVVNDATLTITERSASEIEAWLGDALHTLTSPDARVTSGLVQFAVLNMTAGHTKASDIHSILQVLDLPRSTYVSQHIVKGLTVSRSFPSSAGEDMTMRSVVTFRCGVVSVYNQRTHQTVGLIWYDSTNDDQVLEVLQKLCQRPMLVFHPMMPVCLYTRALSDMFTSRVRSDTSDLFKAQMDSGFQNYDESSPGKTAENLDLAALSGSVCGSNINITFYEQCFRTLHVLLQQMQQQNSTMTFGSQIPGGVAESARATVGASLAEQVQQVEHMIEITQLWQRQALIVTQGIFNLIAQRDSKMNIEIAKDSKFLAEQSQRIAEESKKDTTSMEAIAAVTMFFLPATFVASFLAMPIFQLNDSTGRLTAHQMWLFWVITIPLTIATVVSWLTWTTLSARKRQKQQVLNEKSNA